MRRSSGSEAVRGTNQSHTAMHNIRVDKANCNSGSYKTSR